MLKIHSCSLVIVDVQGKLAQLMYDKEILFKNIVILIRAAKTLQIPIIWCQQCPDSLGPTIPEIAQLLTDDEPVNKSSFSCCGDEQFKIKLKELSRNQILLCGIESHVCIYQTALDLLLTGFSVHVLADAVSSRMQENKQIALSRMAAEGVKISSTEMVLFELLQSAEHPLFRDIAKLVK